MSTITYKGYQAAVAYEDGALFVKVLHVDDVLIARCDTAADVETAFRELIDDYIEDCREAGREPTKPFSGTFNVRVDKEVHRRVAMAAAQGEISLNSWVGIAIVEKLECGQISNRMDKIFVAKHRELAMLKTVRFGTPKKPDEPARLSPSGRGFAIVSQFRGHYVSRRH